MKGGRCDTVGDVFLKNAIGVGAEVSRARVWVEWRRMHDGTLQDFAVVQVASVEVEKQVFKIGLAAIVLGAREVVGTIYIVDYPPNVFGQYHAY